MAVRVQQQDFDVGAEIQRLRMARPDTGAIVTFVGQVRDVNDGRSVNAMYLEHYPGMTEKSLEQIVSTAKQRWDVFDIEVIHRIGQLNPSDQIVFVAVTGAHRKEAFMACEYVMDYLKTEAPFWKKEQTPSGEHWVEAKETDDVARDRWQP